MAGRQFRCSITYDKRSFHRSLNAIFGKVGRLASEEVTLELVRSKCLSILLFGLECYSLFKADLRSLDFVVTQFLMKLFRSSNIDIINDCRLYLSFPLLSEIIEKRREKFLCKFKHCDSIVRHFGICGLCGI